MPTGTTLVTFKQAELERLKARPALARVQITYSEPSVYERDTCMWFGGATAEASLHAMRGGGTFSIDEDIRLTMVIQAISMVTDGQETADVAAAEALRELQQELAETPQPTTDIQLAEFVGWEQLPGKTEDAGAGYACRFEATIRVRANLT